MLRGGLRATPDRIAQFTAMTSRMLEARIRAVSAGVFDRNDRQTGRRLRAATTSKAPALAHVSGARHPDERARLLERLVGPHSILPAYGRGLPNICRRTAELRVENRETLRQVRELQTCPTSSRERTRR